MFLAFAYDIPLGGFYDYRTKFDTLEEAKDYVKFSGVSTAHIVFIGNKTFKFWCDFDKQRTPQWINRT